MFSEQLKKLRIEHNCTQEKLADGIGVAKSTISMYENGKREPDFETLEAIADFFNVNMSCLFDKSKKDDIFNIPGISPIRTKKVPRLGTIACGEPILAEQNIETFDDVDVSVNCDFSLKCKGDSMINARIFDGDIVFIKQQPDVENGEIAAVLIGNEIILKKVYKQPNKLILSPCNPMFQDMLYQDKQLEDVRILGKVVCFLSYIK